MNKNKGDKIWVILLNDMKDSYVGSDIEHGTIVGFQENFFGEQLYLVGLDEGGGREVFRTVFDTKKDALEQLISYLADEIETYKNDIDECKEYLAELKKELKADE